METVRDFILGGSIFTADGDCSHEIKWCLCLGKKSYDKPRQHNEKQRYYSADKGPSSQSYGFSGSHVWMWELSHQESWGLKNWCFWTVMLEKTLESPLDWKEIQTVHPKENQSWIFFGRTDVEAEIPMLGKLMWRTNTLEETQMLRKIEGGRRRGWQTMRWLDGISNVMDISLGRLWELVMDRKPRVLQSMRSQIDTTERLNCTDWPFLW